MKNLSTEYRVQSTTPSLINDSDSYSQKHNNIDHNDSLAMTGEKAMTEKKIFSVSRVSLWLNYFGMLFVTPRSVTARSKATRQSVVSGKNIFSFFLLVFISVHSRFIALFSDISLVFIRVHSRLFAVPICNNLGYLRFKKSRGAALITLIFILLLFFILSIGILNLVFFRKVTQDKLYYKFAANRLAENGAQIAIYEINKNFFGFNGTIPFKANKQGTGPGQIPEKISENQGLQYSGFETKNYGIFSIFTDGKITFTMDPKTASKEEYEKYSLSRSGKKEELTVTYKAENIDFNDQKGDITITSVAKLDGGRYRSVCEVKYRLKNLLDFALFLNNKKILYGGTYGNVKINSTSADIYFNSDLDMDGLNTVCYMNSKKIYINGNLKNTLAEFSEICKKDIGTGRFTSTIDALSVINYFGKEIKIPVIMRYDPQDKNKVVIPYGYLDPGNIHYLNYQSLNYSGVSYTNEFNGLTRDWQRYITMDDYSTRTYSEPVDEKGNLKPYARQTKYDYGDLKNMPLANVDERALEIMFNSSNTSDAQALSEFFKNNGLYDKEKNYKVRDKSLGATPIDLPESTYYQKLYKSLASSNDKFINIDTETLKINNKEWDKESGINPKIFFNPQIKNDNGPLQGERNPLIQWENDKYSKEDKYTFVGMNRDCVELDFSKYKPAGNVIYSEVPLLIKNAKDIPKDVTIYSDQGIYLSGDFNNGIENKKTAIITPSFLITIPDSPDEFKQNGREILEYSYKKDSKGNITGFDMESANYDEKNNPYGFLYPDTSLKNPKPDCKLLKIAVDETQPSGRKDQYINSALMVGSFTNISSYKQDRDNPIDLAGLNTIHIKGSVISMPYNSKVNIGNYAIKSDGNTKKEYGIVSNIYGSSGGQVKGQKLWGHFLEGESNADDYFPENNFYRRLYGTTGSYIAGIPLLIPNIDFIYQKGAALIPPAVELLSYIIK